MGDDIVERLRAVSERYRYNTPQHLAENIDAAADEIERLRAREQDLRMHAEQDACEIERLRTADNLLNRAERLIAAGDKLAQGVLDEHQPFPNDEHINLWWLVANWQEARRG